MQRIHGENLFQLNYPHLLTLETFCLIFQEREEKVQRILEEERQGFIRSLQSYNAQCSSRMAAYRGQLKSVSAFMDSMKQLTQSEGKTYNKSVMTCCKILVHSSILQEKHIKQTPPQNTDSGLEAEWKSKATDAEKRAKVSDEELKAATGKLKDMEKIIEEKAK